MNSTTVSFKTVGCRLNSAETAIIRASFESTGFCVMPSETICDVYVIHGCTVTAKAESDSLRLARSARRLNPHAFIVLAGCVAETGGETARAACGADIMAGQKDKFDLPAILGRHGITPEMQPISHKNTGPHDILLPRFDTTRAMVKIQNGCDFRCAYCIVPLARGAPVSRPANEIIQEISGLSDAGFKEVVLTGANIGCYDDTGKKLHHLLERIEKLTTIERLRISSIEISTIERDVIAFMADSRKLCKFLHIPLQSGDDRLLMAMGRRYNTKQYQDLIEYATSKLGSFGLGTDMLVGFPGEDDRAFAATENFVTAMPFNNLHVFPYSRRPGTRAADLAKTVPDTLKKERVKRISHIGKRKRKAFAESRIGKKTNVLIETLDEAGHGTGWTEEYLKACIRRSGLQQNQIINFTPRRSSGEILIT